MLVAGHKRCLDAGDAPADAQLRALHSGSEQEASQQLLCPATAADDGLAGGQPPGRGPWELRVMRAFAGVLQDPGLEPTSDFFAAGGDSMAAAAVAAELGVPPQLLAGFPTARSLAAHLAAADFGATQPTRLSSANDVGVAPLGSLGPGTVIGQPGSAMEARLTAAQRFSPIPKLDVRLDRRKQDPDDPAVSSAATDTEKLIDPDKPALVLSRGGRCRAAGRPTEGDSELRIRDESIRVQLGAATQPGGCSSAAAGAAPDLLITHEVASTFAGDPRLASVFAPLLSPKQ